MSEKHGQILNALAAEYSQAKTALNYETPFQMLVAVILSAQCTDERVNKVTVRLFADFPTVGQLAGVTATDLEPYVRSCGLYRNKSKNIVAAAQKIVQEFDGKVPHTMEGLLSLPGVGRKTANVVLSNIYNQPAIAVDTHVLRVANRLGLANSSTPIATENDLQQVIPKEQWGDAHHWLIYHGRGICKARRPLCGDCCVSEWCQQKK